MTLLNILSMKNLYKLCSCKGPDTVVSDIPVTDLEEFKHSHMTYDLQDSAIQSSQPLEIVDVVCSLPIFCYLSHFCVCEPCFQ